jgi:hypothetical protein
VVYLLALVFPIAFFYSPKVETSGSVFIAKPMTITQQRKSPAYDVFLQTQKVLHSADFEGATTDRHSNDFSDATTVVNLNSNESQSDKIILSAAPLVIDQKELLAETDVALEKMVIAQGDSTMVSNIEPPLPQVLSASEPQFSQNKSESITIRGHFELSEGVGIVDHIVGLRRVFEGQSYELGEVDLNAGMYQIQVGSFEGELVAEIKDQNGLMIGEDRQKISGLKRSGLFFSGPAIKVGQPVTISMNARNVDDRKISASDYTGSLYSGNYSLKKTTDSYPNVASLSSTVGVVIDTSGKNATTLSLRTAKDSAETLLFSQKWIDGIKSYLSEKLQIQYLPQSGIIIGRVLRNGKPMAGAQVVIDNQLGVEPYYLDQFLIPQVAQTTTSANGFFVIPGMNNGHYQISAFINNQHLGSQLYFVEDNIVSYQEILSTTRLQSVVTRSFDAFTANELDVDLILPGVDNIFTVTDGFARYRSSTVSGLQEIFVRPVAGAYTPFVYLQNSKKDHLHLPLIRDEFLEALRIQNQIPLLPNTSTFIAFAPNGEFDLHLTVDHFNRKHIVYFNSKGEAVPDSVPGGGFIIFNLPAGLQEIILLDRQTDKTFSQVVSAVSEKIYMTHFTD